MDISLKKNFEKNVVRISLVEEEYSFFEKKDDVTALKIGIGKNEINRRQFILVVRKIIHFSKQYNLKKIAVDLNELKFSGLKIDENDRLELIASNLLLANFKFVDYRTKPKSGWDFLEEVHLITPDISEEVEGAIKRGIIMGEEVNDCRTMVNTPSNDLRPTTMATQVLDKFKNTKVEVKILGKKEIKENNMGGILEVASGSEQDPKLIILEYNNGGDEDPIVLIGKAVTFDSGGLCLKPSAAMLEMHMDMAGGASVIFTMGVIERLKLKKNVVAVIPSVENLVSITNYRPNDIITMMSGISVEILNTDAEGRLILGDALTYVQKYYNPKHMIDVATLTGGARIALGLRATALFSTDEKVETKLRELGEKVGNYVWPLPLWDEYKADMKGKFSDIANIATTSNPRNGSAVTAAAFLSYFVEENRSWVHLDIAPRMTTLPEEYLAPGASGEPVGLLAKAIEVL